MKKIKKLIDRIVGFVKNKYLFVLVFSSFFLLFPAGMLNKETTIQETSSNISKIIKNNTEQKNYCSLIVEPKQNEEPITTDTYSAFTSLYGIFGESRTNFVGAVNADKKGTVFIEELSEKKNLSFVYVERAGFHNVQYQEAWKHQFYPLPLMFQGVHSYSNSFSFCYISESQAKEILASRGIDFSTNECEKLLGTDILLKMNGIDYSWKIANIYFENNAFCDAVHEVMGDFLIGYNKFPEDFPKQSIYFMRQQVFQNSYLIKRCLKTYPQSKYNYRIGDYNLIDKNVTNSVSITNNAVGDVFSVILFAVSILSLIATSIQIYYCKDYLSLFHVLILFTFSLCPIALFRLISLLIHSAYCFPSLSIIIYLICSAAFILFLSLIFIYLFNKQRKRKLL